MRTDKNTVSLCNKCTETCWLDEGSGTSIDNRRVATVEWNSPIGAGLFLVIAFLIAAYTVHYYCKEYGVGCMADIIEVFNATFWWSKIIPTDSAIISIMFMQALLPLDSIESMSAKKCFFETYRTGVE